MIILVSGATRTVARYPPNKLGVLVTPRTGNSLATVASSGRLWAADNDCFQRLDTDAYESMLARISDADRSQFLWVTIPDVVGKARDTIDRWSEWHPRVARLGLDGAFVGQDGIEEHQDCVPWGKMRALFIGGSDAWKESRHAAELSIEAKRRGLWVHVGRVNSLRRIRRIWWHDADSIDGGGFSKWPDINIPKGLKWISQTSHPRLIR
jgi:hypothetical protein